MKRLLFVFILILSIFTLNACKKIDVTDDKEKTGMAYGITHKDYVGFTTVKVKGDKITDVTIDEAYLPTDWAKVTVGEEVPNDVIVNGSTWYAKYIIIGDKHFTGSLRDTDLVIEGVTYTKEKVKYSAEGIDDLYVWLRASEVNCKWYVKQIQDNKISIANANWEESSYDIATTALTKSQSGYWPSTSSGLGWQENMNQIIKAVKGTKVEETNIVKGEDNYWMIGDVKTGATLADFKDYYTLIQRAYKNAK